MKNAYAVIGSAWGDEGKGNVTDIFCSINPSRTINVRINGGAQASHTVVTPKGERHAFRHFGSGTFAGTPTYLSKEFMANIFTFDMERNDLEEKFISTVNFYSIFCANRRTLRRRRDLWYTYFIRPCSQSKRKGGNQDAEKVE